MKAARRSDCKKLPKNSDRVRANVEADFRSYAGVDVFNAQCWCRKGVDVSPSEVFSCTHSKIERNNKTHQHKRSRSEKEIIVAMVIDNPQKKRENIFHLVRAPCFHRFGARLAASAETPATLRVCVKRNHITSRYLFLRQPAKWFVFIIILLLFHFPQRKRAGLQLLWPKQLVFRFYFFEARNNFFIGTLNEFLAFLSVSFARKWYIIVSVESFSAELLPSSSFVSDVFDARQSHSVSLSLGACHIFLPQQFPNLL